MHDLTQAQTLIARLCVDAIVADKALYADAPISII